MSGDPHTRHVDEFRPKVVIEPPSSGNYTIGSVDTTSGSTGSTLWLSLEDRDYNADEEKRQAKIQQNKEWERRLWKARQNGRNVPPFPKR